MLPLPVVAAVGGHISNFVKRNHHLIRRRKTSVQLSRKNIIIKIVFLFQRRHFGKISIVRLWTENCNQGRV